MSNYFMKSFQAI